MSSANGQLASPKLIQLWISAQLILPTACRHRNQMAPYLSKQNDRISSVICLLALISRYIKI